MAYETILVEQQGAVTLITLNRPQVLNAMTYSMHAELARLWHDIDHDPDARAVVAPALGKLVEDTARFFQGIFIALGNQQHVHYSPLPSP